MVNILNRIVIVISINLYFQAAYGMLGVESELAFLRTGDQPVIPLPHLRRQGEGDRQHMQAYSRNVKLSKSQKEALLVNGMIFSVDTFTEENIKTEQGLERVGVLKIHQAEIYCTPLDPTRIVKLIEKYFPQVLNLQLNNLALADAGFNALAQSDRAIQLKVLNISSCGITAQGFTVKNLNRFSSLRELELAGNQIGNEGFLSLIQSDRANQLKMLNIELCGITGKEFTVENLNRFKHLKWLMAGENQMDDVGFLNLVKSNIAIQLEALSVNRFGELAREFTIENLNRLKKLEGLYTQNNQLGENALATLMQSDLCKTLRFVISGSGLPTDAILVELLKYVHGNFCSIENR